MRRVVALVVLSALAACGHAQRGPAVSDDGRAAIVGGQAWRAPEGVTFVARDGDLHVVSVVPGAAFDVAVPLDARGRAALPADAPFELRDGQLQLRDRSLPPRRKLVESGQLYPHDDHFHLTHLWDNADWRALYRAREEGSDLPGATRQAAAFALATLLDHRIPGTSEEALAKGLRRMAETVGRARRAVEGAYPAKQIMAMVVHDFEILDDGATLSIEGKTYRAAGDVRFSYCGDHFHVEDAGGAWAQPISLLEFDSGAFDMPPSMFFEVSGDKVAVRAGGAPWKDLLARGEIKLGGDRWYVTESYSLGAFASLEQAAVDRSLPEPLRERARRAVLEALKLPLDIESDAAFQAALAGVDARIEARWREVQARLPPPKRR